MVCSDSRFFACAIAAAFVLAVAMATPVHAASAPVRLITGVEGNGDRDQAALVSGGALVFARAAKPWRSDGTVAGTYQLQNVSSLAEFVTAGNYAFFRAFDDLGAGLWRTDGTVAGTVKVIDVSADSPVAVGSEVWFNVCAAGACAVWRSDGTPGGTQMVKAGFTAGGEGFTRVGPLVYFIGHDAAAGAELWKSDGTPGGTTLVKDLTPGPADSSIGSLRALNGALVFAGPGATRHALYRSDGTAAGTQMVRADVIINNASSMGPASGGSVYFPARTAAGSLGLWRTDGTFGGTFAVRPPDADLNTPGDFVAHGPLVYFTASITEQFAIARTDGTINGTFGLKGGVYPLLLGGIGGRYYFHRAPGIDQELWVTDGTQAGTRLHSILSGAARWSRPAPGGLFMALSTGTGAYDLWILPAEEPGADLDGDGIPNDVEAGLARNPAAKDNDVFADAQLFAMQQYRDFLGREGDAGGIAFHAQRISSGAANRPQVVQDFLASSEFQAGLPQMIRLYFAFFNRIPDYAGLMFQVAAYRSGAPLGAIAQNFSLSPEFTGTYGSLTDEQYVDLVYQNVLGRAADAGGRAYYLERLGDGRLTRGAMMVGFSESPEAQQLLEDEVYVIAVYVGLLRRAPEQSGLDFYVNIIEQGVPRNAIVDGFLASPEYRGRFLP